MTMEHAPLHFEQSSLPTGSLGLSISLSQYPWDPDGDWAVYFVRPKR
jgi:hypothetical protein